MSDELFVKAEKPFASMEGALQDADHKMCARLDADTPEAYRFGAVQHDQTGTLVPVPNGNGGILGSRNPFGQIVVGEEYVKINGELKTRVFAPTWLADAIPKPRGKQMDMPDVAPQPVFDADPATKAEVDAKLEQEAAVRRVQMSEEVAKQREAEEVLQTFAAELPAAPPEAPSAQQVLQTFADSPPAGTPLAGLDPNVLAAALTQALQGNLLPTPAAAGEPPATVPDKEVRVKMTGNFGTYKGTYDYVYQEGDFVILVYSEDAQVFTPPQSDEPFTLSCNSEEHSVYFPGIEFELPFANCGLQVMIRSS